MHRLLALVVVIGGCGGSSRAPSAPGGELTEDPCAGGEAKQQVAVADPCDGGEAQGGLGLRGTGEGGGGVGSGPGIGTVGTIGHGSGQGTGTGDGGGAPGRARWVAPKVTLGKHVVEGKLAPELVSRVVRRYITQVRYCYEKTLAARPDATGLLTLDLVISPDGDVAQAKASGVAPDLETCVMQRAMTWKFAKPTSGIVKVSIPITLAPPP